MHGLPWTAWLLILSGPVIGLGIALRFWIVQRDAGTDAGEAQ